MKKRRLSNLCRRVLAGFLALVLALGTFVDDSFVSQAAETTPTYTGREENNQLFIEYHGFSEEFPFNEQNIMAVLNTKADGAFDNIYISYPDQTTKSVSAELWNLAVQKINSNGSNPYVQYAFIGNGSYNMDWNFQRPTAAASAVVMDASISFGNTMTVSFASTAFPAESASLSLNTDSNLSDYAAFGSAFGTESVMLEYVDGNGALENCEGRYDIGSWDNNGTTVYSRHVSMHGLNQLQPNTTYTLQEKVYRGRVDSWFNGERQVSRLVLSPMEAGKGSAGFTLQEILDILDMHTGSTYDEAYIEQPIALNVIYKDVTDKVLGLLNPEFALLEYAFVDYPGNLSARWIMHRPQAMTGDQTVSFTLDFDGSGAAYINTGSVDNLKAENIELAYYTSVDNADANALKAALGTNQIKIAAGDTDVSGNYGVDEYNVWFRLNQVQGLAAGQNYTLAKQKYTGNVYTEPSGRIYLEINHNEVLNGGEIFDDTTLKNILDAHAGSTFGRVYIFAPSTYTTVSKEVWNAAVSLIDNTQTQNGPPNLQIGHESSQTYHTHWEFMFPAQTDNAVTLQINTNWSTDGSGMKVSFPTVDYPCSELVMSFGAATGWSDTDTSFFTNAFGNNTRNLEIVKGTEHVDNTQGHYSVNVWDDGNVNYNLNFSNVINLQANTEYTVQPFVYRGDENTWDNGWTNLQIHYNPFQNEGKVMDDAAIKDILEQKYNEGKTFNSVSITYPDGASTSIPADVWNTAVKVLKPYDGNDEGSSSNLEFIFDQNDGYTTCWAMHWPKEVEAAVELSGTFTFLNGTGMNLSVNNTDIPAEDVSLNLNTDTNRADAAMFADAFGPELMKLELVDSNGQVMDRLNGWYNVDHWDDGGINYSINFGNIKDLETGAIYRVQEMIYKGRVDSWFDGERQVERLNISPMEAGKDGVGFTEQEILDILDMHAGNTYDDIYIEQPNTENVIYKDVNDKVLGLLKPESAYVEYTFVDYSNNSRIAWALHRPEAMTGDQAVSFTLDFNGSGAPYINIGSVDNLKAENIELAYYTFAGNADANALRAALGTDQIRIAAGDTDVSGDYNADEDNVWFRLNQVQGLAAGQNYTLAKQKYTGHVDTEPSGRTNLNIDYNEIINSGESFSNAKLKEILDAHAGSEFHRVYIFTPSAYTSVPADVWNAAVSLLTTVPSQDDDMPSVQIGHDGGQGYNTHWEFGGVVQTDKAVSLQINTNWSTDGSGMRFSFPALDYPADMLKLNFDINTERGDTSLFTDAFGYDYRHLEIVNGTENMNDTWGDYNVNVWDNGTIEYHVHFGNAMSLQANTEYTLQNFVYRGDEEIWDDGRENLSIHFRGFEDSGKVMDEDAIKALLEQKYMEGKVYDRVSVTYPDGAVRSISADIWNMALKLLRPYDGNDEEIPSELEFVFEQNDSYTTYWTMSWPKETEGAVDLSSTAAFVSGAGMDLTVSNTDIPAEGVHFSMGTDTNFADAAMFADAFGPERMRLEFVDNEGQVVSWIDGWYDVDRWDDGGAYYGVNTGAIKELESGVTYRLQKFVYRGDVNTWQNDDGSEESDLYLDPRSAGKENEVFTVDELIEVLQRNALESFDRITIRQPAGAENVISKAVVEEAQKYLKPEGQRGLRFEFEDYDTGIREEWDFARVSAIEADQIVKTTVAMEGGSPYISTVVPRGITAEEMRVEYCIPIENNVLAQDLLAAFGGHECRLAVGDLEAAGEFWINDYDVRVSLFDFEEVEDNEKYTLARKVYAGDEWTDGETYELNIHWGDFDQAEGGYSEEALLALLEKKAEEGKFYNHIFMNLPKPENIKKFTFSKEIWNAAVALLKSETDYTPWMNFDFNDGETLLYSWSFEDPETTAKDVALGADVDFSTNGTSVNMKFANTTFPAQMTDFYVSVDSNNNNFEENAEIFQKAFNYQQSLYLVLSKGGKAIDNVSGYYDYFVDEENGYANHTLYARIPEGLKATDTIYAIPMYWYEEELKVGTAVDWSTILTYTPDPGKKVTYKATEHMAEVTAEGMLTPFNEGYFVIRASYYVDGKLFEEQWECYAGIELKSISFDMSEYVTEYYEDVPDRNNFWLSLYAYPSNAPIEDDSIDITYSGDPIITRDYEDMLMFRVTGTGEAVITATVRGTGISASCRVTAEPQTKLSQEMMDELANVYIVTNFDKTLADVELPEGCEWKYPNTDLKNYAGMTVADFPILCTATNGRVVEAQLVEIALVTIKGLELIPVDDSLLTDGKPVVELGEADVVFAYDVIVENGTWDQIIAHKAFETLQIVPTGMVSCASADGYDSNPDYEDCFVFLNDASGKAGKKTVKLSLVQNNKTIVTDSQEIQVTKTRVYGFQGVVIRRETEDYDGNPNTGNYYMFFTNPCDYYKPTIKSSDSSVLKLGKIEYPTAAEVESAKDDGGVLRVTIPYTEVKPGIVEITITLPDEVKSTRKELHVVADRTPKVLETSFAINTSYEEKRVPITIQYTADYGMLDQTGENLVIVDNENFLFERVSSVDAVRDTNRLEGYLTIKEGAQLKNGNYKLDLLIPVDISADGDYQVEANKDQHVQVTVKVTNTKPKVTIKQTEKVNLFYDQTLEGSLGTQSWLFWNDLPAGYGLLEMTSKDGDVRNVKLTGTDAYKVYELTDGYYAILAVTGGDEKSVKATLTYDVINSPFGEIRGLTKELKISTVNKAPTLQLSQKSETLYPGYEGSAVFVYDKTTGLPLEFSEIQWVKSKTEAVDIAIGDENGTEIDTGKNTYNVLVQEDDNYIYFVLQNESEKDSADTLKLRVKQDNWKGYVEMSYKISVKCKAPKVKLSNSKLTLNINEDVYAYQAAASDIIFDGYQSIPWGLDVRFVGLDAKSKAVLNEELTLYQDSGRIIARFNITPDTPEDERPSGTYKYKVWMSNGWFETSTTLTVNVVDKAVDKCIKLSKSGSIDVLRRYDSPLIYKTKISNLSGELIYAEVMGTDSYKFYADCYDGNVYLYAADGAELSTAVSYKVGFNLCLRNPDGSEYNVTTPEQTFKVTQGKPKVTLNAEEGNVLYTQTDAPVVVQISADLKGNGVSIANVTLANYQNDLALYFDEPSQQFALKRIGMDKINTNGKTWSVKLNVTFQDQAGNLKDTQVTYKLKIQ